MNISGSVFSNNNSLVSSGGAIYVQTNDDVTATEAVITNTKFLGNKAALSGGAIGINDSGSGHTAKLVINSSYFSDNVASEVGGAIVMTSSGGLTEVFVNSSEFVGNTAQKGSAIYATKGNLTNTVQFISMAARTPIFLTPNSKITLLLPVQVSTQRFLR